jgi:hypothetical protein
MGMHKHAFKKDGTLLNPRQLRDSNEGSISKTAEKQQRYPWGSDYSEILKIDKKMKHTSFMIWWPEWQNNNSSW